MTNLQSYDLALKRPHSLRIGNIGANTKGRSLVFKRQHLAVGSSQSLDWVDQAEVEEARSGLQQEWQRAQAAAADRAVAMNRLDDARSDAVQLLASLDSKCEALSATYTKVKDCKTQLLRVPSHFWRASQCSAPLGKSDTGAAMQMCQYS